jgi:O-acetyl-ADP-ribose deacetylase (regulator of RNase III)
LTPGFKLAAKHVIHAVGPRWLGGSSGEAELLERCYHSVFDLAVAHGLRTVCSPSISTGIYRFPLDEASWIAARVAKDYQPSLEICFVCYDEGTAEAYRSALRGQ